MRFPLFAFLTVNVSFSGSKLLMGFPLFTVDDQSMAFTKFLKFLQIVMTSYDNALLRNNTLSINKSYFSKLKLINSSDKL